MPGQQNFSMKKQSCYSTSEGDTEAKLEPELPIQLPDTPKPEQLCE